ncbi:hypothetical protein BK131_00885 [Paenibacillus amylolyticus]|uniref:Uncharacterized protein n=1 Tax=Paenibacillus amylolyticus TaxID=1451 RepID=A0A1R1C383_PAEAM|nr:hypothetical protein [Paenibacillus amylolyticus]OMF16585.1 hypothetical protein BK131_00885 [Paenibacillus amylolyticus]
MNNKMLLFSVVTLCILLILGFLRWDNLESSADLHYKYDRWAGQKWVEFYPPLAASSNSMAFPLIYMDEIHQNDINKYLEKQALTGELVNKWIERTKLTDGYIGLLLLNILVVIYSSIKLFILRDKK